MEQGAESEAFYNLSAHMWNGEKVDFEAFRGCVLLIANVASSCKFAKSNYKSFVELLEKYFKKGLRILLFPCNQYLGQEPGEVEEIWNEVSEKYSDKLELFEKVNAFGKDIHPVFKHLIATENGRGTLGNFIKWNFTKFLVDRTGRVVKRFGPSEIVKEDDEDLVRSIEKEQPAPERVVSRGRG